MTRRKYENYVVDSSGDAQASAEVSVRDAAGNLLTLYSEETGATQAYSGSNPFTSGNGSSAAAGYFAFWAEVPVELNITGGASPTDFTLRHYLDAPIDAIEARVADLETVGASGAQFTSGGPVACATTANITLSGEQTLDGVLTSTDRVLVKDQADPEDNGLYVSAAGAWSRATDMNLAAEVAGTAVFVSAGAVNGGKTYATYSAVTTLGTDTIVFVETGSNAGVQDQLDAKAPLAEFDELIADRGEAGLVLIDDSAPVVPIVWGGSGAILLGYDTTTRSLVGGNTDSIPAMREQTRALRYPPRFSGYSHVMYYGQSLAAGVASGSPITTSQPYSNVTFDGGTRDFSSLASYIPLVESTVEVGVATACNKAVSMFAEDGGATADLILIGSSAAQGSKTIAQLEKEGTEDWYKDQLIVQMQGAMAIDSDYSLVAVPWLQGESDVLIPTSEAVYKADMQSLIADINFDANTKNMGNGPVHLLTYQTLINSRVRDNMTEAQRNAALENDLIHTVIPIYHIEHAADKTHLTAGGYRHVGAYFGRAIYELYQGLVPQSLYPISATNRGAIITVKMNVPTLPLVLDAVNLYATTDSGFAVEDTTGVLTISSVAVDGNTVVITTSTTPSGATVVRYALDYISGSVPTDYPSTAATGNLRDSTPGTVDVSGVAKPLWYPSLHFKLSVTELSE